MSPHDLQRADPLRFHAGPIRSRLGPGCLTLALVLSVALGVANYLPGTERNPAAGWFLLSTFLAGMVGLRSRARRAGGQPLPEASARAMPPASPGTADLAPLRAVMDASPVATLLCTRTGQIAVANRAAAALLQRPQTQLPGMRARKLLARAQRVPNPSVQEAAPGSPPSAAREFELIRPTGGRALVRIETRPVELPSGPAVLATATDLTARSQDDSLSRQDPPSNGMANEELDAFAHSVAHDLRAPLRAMAGFSQALSEDCAEQLDPEGLEYLARIQKASKHMSEMLDGLLSLCRLSQQALQPQEVDLTELVESLARERQRGHSRPTRVTVQPGLRAVADPRQLRLLLANLLDNALKYSAQHPEPCIEFGRADSARGPAFFVTDNGVGFNPGSQSQLFSPFARVAATTKDAGIGIGLAAAERIVRRHRGTIWAEAEPARGATFYFQLALPPSALDAPASGVRAVGAASPARPEATAERIA